MAYTLGIDVSVWQDSNSTPQQVDFLKAYRNGARFAYIKASQSTFMDEDILYNWKSSKSAGLLRGAYHFLTWERPEQQAQFFWSLLKNDYGELPAVVDYEWWSTIPSNALQILWAFLVEFKRISGKTPALYTAPGFWQPYGKTNTEWAQFPLWVADYGANNPNYPKARPTIPAPWTKFLFWQFSSKGDGLAFGCESKSVDLDYFNGTEEELYAFAGLSVPAEEDKPVDPPPATWKGKVRVGVSALNVRSSPSISAPRVGMVGMGQYFDILDLGGGDSWVKISDGKWICAKQGKNQYVTVE